MRALTDVGRKIIEDIVYLTLATSDKEGRAWCTPLFTAFDRHYTFYWSSGFETRHSMNIRNNPIVAAVVYDSSRDEGLGEGVYMEGSAEELAPSTWREGFELLRSRSRDPEKFYPTGSFESLGPVRIYRFCPQSFSMLDPKGDSRYTMYADRRLPVDLKRS